jgi:tetratricopeptide (TPR) repeat protein
MAIANFNQALRVADPNDSYNISAAYNDRGLSWYHKGEYDKAIADYNQALAVNPNYAIAYNNRGNTWEKKGEYDKAIADYNQALVINPKDAIAYNNRGNTWEKKGEYDKAIADYNQALAVNPNYANAYENLGWLYSTCPDANHRYGKKAFENANKAYQLDGGKSWTYIDTLAAAYAESDDFDRASEWETKAIKLMETDKKATDKDKQELNARLELYKQGKPYRQEPKKK